MAESNELPPDVAAALIARLTGLTEEEQERIQLHFEADNASFFRILETLNDEQLEWAWNVIGAIVQRGLRDAHSKATYFAGLIEAHHWQRRSQAPEDG